MSSLAPSGITPSAIHEQVLRWRPEGFVAAGYPAKAARELSERTDVDLYMAVGVLQAGCTVETALRILR